MSFASRGTEDIYNGLTTKAARATLPVELHRKGRAKLDQLLHASNLSFLKYNPSNHLEELKGDRAGQYSLRVNLNYRVCFRWTDDGATDVEIVDYH
ncbi:MAG: type II toxin-antitoxin system RelE/ParE family toxin [Candidatus Eremiobacteraeota bacterium]|nr:type II toxin-antitoxin system RelE/ParE family toxin [Candidatus Eremiobacteraeota bacterium]